MKSTSAPLLFLLAVLAAPHADALINGCKELSVDFTDSKDAAQKAKWSEPDKLTISGGGLGWEGEPEHSRDGWIETQQIAVGLSWRPPSAVVARVAIHPSGEGHVYVRYS